MYSNEESLVSYDLVCLEFILLWFLAQLSSFLLFRFAACGPEGQYGFDWVNIESMG